MGQEDGVEFEDPKKPGSRMLLTPEKSIESQNDIGADIMTALGFAQFQASKQCPSEFSRMALDDVATRPVVFMSDLFRPVAPAGVFHAGSCQGRGPHQRGDGSDFEMAAGRRKLELPLQLFRCLVGHARIVPCFRAFATA